MDDESFFDWAQDMFYGLGYAVAGGAVVALAGVCVGVIAGVL